MIRNLTEADEFFVECFYNARCLIESTFAKGTPRNYNDGKDCIKLRLYQRPFLGFDSAIEDDNRLSEVENFRRRIKVGTRIIVSARKIGKTFIALVANILLKLVHYRDLEMTMTSYDEKHVDKVLDNVKEFMVYHNFYKSYKQTVRGSPEYLIETRNGNKLFGINETVKGKSPGENWWGHHTFINFQDEIQAETETAYTHKVDAVSELGVMEILCGIPLITKVSPLGRTLRDKTLKRSIIRLPQYVSHLWDDITKERRIRDYGGFESAGFRINVAADLIEGAFGAFDMERVKTNNNKKRVIKRFEVTKKSFKDFKSLLVIEPIINADRVYVSADIGDAAATEINVFARINNRYHLIYNITTYRLSLTQELPDVIEWIFKRVKGNFLSVDCCFDDKTEILTDNGWRTYNTILKTDKVLSLNPNNGIAYYKNIDSIYLNENYNGNMFEANGKINFLITPEHKLLTHRHNHTKKWELDKIKDLVNSNIERFYMKQDCKWIGNKKKFIIIKGKSQYNGKKIKKIKYPMDLWLRFMGWFISEGHLDYNPEKSKFSINICQRKQEGRIEIENLLIEMGITFSYTKNECYNFANRILSEHLLKNCYNNLNDKLSWNKKIPSYIKELSSTQIREFLLSFCKGDGTFNKDGSKTYYTTSKQLADDIQELILKSGNKSSLRITNNEGFKGYNHLPIYRIQEFKETNRTACVYNKNIKKINYSGIIWCVETNPYHTIFVRRNGKVYWSGNTIMGKPVHEILSERLNEIEKDRNGNIIKTKKRVFWVAFNEDLVTGFEKNEKGEIIRDSKGNLIEKKENTLVFAVRRLNEMFYDRKFDIPGDDYKFENQFASYVSIISGNKIIYDTTMSEDHYVAAFEVFAILEWNTEQLPNINPVESESPPMGLFKAI